MATYEFEQGGGGAISMKRMAQERAIESECCAAAIFLYYTVETVENGSSGNEAR
jgi:hypothetical protein